MFIRVSRIATILTLAIAGITIPATANATPSGNSVQTFNTKLTHLSVKVNTVKHKTEGDRPVVQVLAFGEYKDTAPDKTDASVGIFGLPTCPGGDVTYGVYLTVENVTTLGQCATDGTITYSVSVAGSDYVLADPNTPIVVKDGIATVPGVDKPIPTNEPTRTTHVAQISYWMQGISFESATAQVPLPTGTTLVDNNPDTLGAQLVAADDGTTVLVLSGTFPPQS